MALRELLGRMRARAPVAVEPRVELADLVFEAGEDVVLAPYSICDWYRQSRYEVILLRRGDLQPLKPLERRPVVRVAGRSFFLEVGVDVYRASDAEAAAAAVVVVNRPGGEPEHGGAFAIAYLDEKEWGTLKEALKKVLGGVEVVDERFFHIFQLGEEGAYGLWVALLRVPKGVRALLVPGYAFPLSSALPIVIVRARGGRWRKAMKRSCIQLNPVEGHGYILAIPLRPADRFAVALLTDEGPFKRKHLIPLAVNAPPGEEDKWLAAIYREEGAELTDLLEPPEEIAGSRPAGS